MLQSVFQVYLSRLIDLSTRNRSIYLPKLVASQAVDLKDFHFSDSREAIHYVHDLIAGKKTIPLIPVLSSRDKSANRLSKRLNRIWQSAKLTEEETGEKSLYLGWPFVEGKLINEQIIKCPLLFFPVDLVQAKDKWCLHQREEAPMLNPSFLLAYAHATGKSLDRDFTETSLDDLPQEPTAFLTALYHLLNQTLSLNFNQQLFEQQLDAFRESGKAEDMSRFQTGLLKLHSQAVLGQFSHKSSFLIRDYEELMQQEGPESLEELFAERFAVAPDDYQEVREDNMLNVFPLDAAQEEVFKAVRAGESCVVEGPPGTGKSQLICNLVADYVARGKKVLVVSQKRAALDVVYDRLKPMGFANFMTLVHDFRSDRKELFKQLSDQIEALDHYMELNRSLDAIQLERGFLKSSRTITSHTEYLEEYKAALYNTEECGIPIKQLYVTGNLQDKGFDLTQYYKHYLWENLDGFFRDLELFRQYYHQYQHNDSFWLHRQDFSAFGAGALTRMRDSFEEILDLKSSAESTLQALMGKSFNYLFIFECFEQKDLLVRLNKLLKEEKAFKEFCRVLPFEAADFDLLWLENKINTVRKLLQEEIEWTLADESVETFYRKTIAVLEARGSFLGRVGSVFEPKKHRDIKELLAQNGLKDNREGLDILMKRLENRLNLNHQYTILKQKKWLKLPAKPFGLQEFDASVGGLAKVAKARLLVEKIGLIRPFMANSIMEFEAFRHMMEEILSINQLIAYKMQAWGKYFSKIQIRHLLSFPDHDKLRELQDSLPQHFTDLVIFDQLRRSLRSIDLELMTKVVQQYPDLGFHQIKMCLVNGLRESWIDHIETKYPVLREITSPKFKLILDELNVAVNEKQELARFNAELKLREQTFRDLEYNRLNNLVTYRDLSHQVRKKKRIWPVKKVLESFTDEVMKLVPCWLASPETVSALFPMQQTFDLVVFDESSQCYVEKGFPAMLRGKQVVVAGDSQQLQPFDLYTVRLEVEEEGLEVETDSLLDLASHYFASYHLSGHYRSQTLPLIHFSNEHFYENRLEMLPDRNLLNSNFQAFELVKVEGIWQKQTNPIEAEEVVALLVKNQQEAPGDTFGVITFNYYQMDLIQEMVSEHPDLDQERIKVKNIENVQGDEFDQVVFSIGYAQNAAGKFTANFGLLSKRGGENRLNVAITRARKKIILVTSLTSQELKTKHLQHEGVKKLKMYLNYVEQLAQGRQLEVNPRPVHGFSPDWLLTELLALEMGDFQMERKVVSPILDLAIRKGEDYVGAVLTDDQRLYGASSAKAAFVYHPEWLKAKHWPVQFVFSRQYWLQQQEVVEGLLKEAE